MEVELVGSKMETSISEITQMARDLEKEGFILLMAICTMEIGMQIRFTVLEGITTTAALVLKERSTMERDTAKESCRSETEN